MYKDVKLLVILATQDVVLQGKPVAQEGQPIAASSPPCLLARLVTEPDLAPTAAAMSACGTFAAVSSSRCTTLLAISESLDKGECADNGIAAVRTQKPLPPACSLCFLRGTQKPQDSFGECWLLMGCMDGRLLCMHVDVTCTGRLAPPITVQLPEEDTLRQAASLQRRSAPASALLLYTVTCRDHVSSDLSSAPSTVLCRHYYHLNACAERKDEIYYVHVRLLMGCPT
jgi:hypothetical protein